MEVPVRGAPSSHPKPLEDGVTCAFRHRVPVVVAGRTTINPCAQFSAVEAGPDEIVATCEQVAAGPRAEHETVATAALVRTLEAAGLPAVGAHASVVRHGDGLRVRLHLPGGTSKRIRSMAVVRVAAALRAFDADSLRIDITCKVPE